MKKEKRKLKIKNFKKRVYEVVKGIPKGEIMTYKEIAQKADFPKTWRAVGNVLNKNRNLKIPCHRVIKSNGKIGGFNRGIKKKIALLKREGIEIKNKRVIFHPVRSSEDGRILAWIL